MYLLLLSRIYYLSRYNPWSQFSLFAVSSCLVVGLTNGILHTSHRHLPQSANNTINTINTSHHPTQTYQVLNTQQLQWLGETIQGFNGLCSLSNTKILSLSRSQKYKHFCHSTGKEQSSRHWPPLPSLSLFAF